MTSSRRPWRRIHCLLSPSHLNIKRSDIQSDFKYIDCDWNHRWQLEVCNQTCAVATVTITAKTTDRTQILMCQTLYTCTSGDCSITVTDLHWYCCFITQIYLLDFIRLCKLYGLTDVEVPKPYNPSDVDQRSTPSELRSERFVTIVTVDICGS